MDVPKKIKIIKIDYEKYSFGSDPLYIRIRVGSGRGPIFVYHIRQFASVSDRVQTQSIDRPSALVVDEVRLECQSVAAIAPNIYFTCLREL